MRTVFLSIGLFCGCMAWGQSKQSITVYFDFDKHELDAVAKRQLDNLVSQQHQLAGIELAGYCDAIGSDHYNDGLSADRAAAVKDYLIANHIDPSIVLKTSAYGENMPLNDNKTATDRRLNRRVEINVTMLKGGEMKAPGTGLSLQQKIADSATVTGTNIVLRNINFYGGTHQFLPESYPMLTELLQVMKAYPSLVIEIQGHICCEPGDEDGLDTETGITDLSTARAQAIHSYLIANGIEDSRVSYKGFAHSQPLYPYPEQTEEERIANRRVEIKIIKK